MVDFGPRLLFRGDSGLTEGRPAATTADCSVGSSTTFPAEDYTMKTSEDSVLGGSGKLFPQTDQPLVSIKVNGHLKGFLEKVRATGDEVVAGEISLGEMRSAPLIRAPTGNLVGLSKDPK
jgi:hypothetical protein